MDPRPFGHPDGGLDVVDERRGVAIGDELAIVHGLYEGGVDHGTSSAQRGDLARGQMTERREAFGGQQLDLEHRLEAMLVAEELRHVLGGVPRDHLSPSVRAECDVTAHDLSIKGYERGALVGTATRLVDRGSRARDGE